ncbi:MAG: UvrD-helicase domain-containing protein [Elusimicrobiaceae bacterium]|nr:UvrD-helicase domain-containing protein [Elusimicrobiaceae bacterium]
MTNPDVLPDRADREAARFVFDRNIIVEAGAGTGKTTLLIERLSFWLLAVPDADAGGVVALTFTEKAAAEIKIRLAARLRKAAELFSGPREELLKDRFCAELADRVAAADTPAGRKKIADRARTALDALERAQLGTIHSFASHILRLFPVEAGIDPQSRIDDGEAAKDFFLRLWQGWLDVELGENAPRKTGWKRALARVSVEDLRKLAEALCRPEMNGYEPLACRAEFVGFCGRSAGLARELAAKYAPKKARKLETALLECAGAFDEFARAFETGDYSASRPPLDCDMPAKPKEWLDEDYAAARPLVGFMRTAALDSHKTVLECVELLRPFVTLYRDRYSHERLLSFNELLVRARDLLKTNFAARSRLKKEYRAILIDEFQDTDPLQGEMLLYLAEDDGGCAASWRELRLKPGKLFVVGDPKQSIYRFRGADMKAYDLFTGLMTAQNALLCRLKTNFRSTPALIGAVNHFTGPVMRREENIQPEYIGINPPPGRTGGTPPHAVLVAGEDGGRISAAESRERQAGLIAGWIRENAGSLELEPGRIMRLKDVAVLLRSAGSLGALLDAFRRAGVGYVVEEKRFFYATQEITDLLNLLAALDNPGDTIALAGLLRSPLAGLSDRELYELRCRGRLDYRLPAPVAAAELFFEKLRAWRVYAGELPSRRFIDTVLRESRAAELLSLAYGGEQTALNVLKFAEIFACAGERSGLGPGAFVRRAADYVAEKTGEGESPLADERLDAVNIMTMHKAKGLEFPVVIIPNISGSTGGGNDRPALLADYTAGLAGLRIGRYADFGMAYLEEREQLHSQAEEVRVFYVALTRARNLLMLFGTDSRFCHHGKFPAGSVAKLLEIGDETVFSGLAGAFLSVERSGCADSEPALCAKNAGLPATRAQDCAAWRALNAAREEQFGNFAGRRLFTSPTGQAKERDFGAEDDDAPQRRELAVLTGSICHKALELHDFRGEITPAETRAAAGYFVTGYPAGLIDAAAKNAAAILAGFAGSAAYGEIARARILGREVPFYYDAGAGVVMRGVMDVVAETDGAVVVYDYKSDAVAPGGEPARALEYEAQKAAYLEITGRLYPAGKSVFKLVFLRTGVIV